MKVRRLLILTLVLSMFGSISVFASSLWGDYEGFEKIRVFINNNEKSFSDNETPAISVKGKPVVPLNTLADSLHSLVKWDASSQTMSVYKPNVHLFAAKEVTKDYTVKQPFGKVKTGDTIDFVVFAQVDNMKAPFHSFKITLVSPTGKEVAPPHEKVINGEKDSFWYPWPFYNVEFSETGEYKIKFEMKLDANSDYTVVAEKAIEAQ